MQQTTGSTPRGCYDEAMRCIQCYDPPCMQGCPAGVNAKKFIRLFREGDILGAAETILRSNPFGWTCGTICPQATLCQKECTANKLGRGINIRQIQQYVMAQARELGLQDSITQACDMPKQRGKAAIIGAGPSGLTCALELANAGFDVEVFEAGKQAGGRITMGIPSFRMDPEQLEAEMTRVKHPLTIHYEKILGKDFTFESLRQAGFGAIYVAIGKWLPRQLNLPGADGPHVYTNDDILLHSGWRNKGYQRAVIIGAGNVAMDVAQTLCKAGIEVQVCFIAGPKEMEAWQEEREENWQQGTLFNLRALPQAVERDEQGSLTALRVQRSQVNKSDKFPGWRADPMPGWEYTLPIDMLVFSIGLGVDAAGLGLTLDTQGNILADETLATSMPGVFAGGDAIGQGRGTVVQAVADGKRAAKSMTELLIEEVR